LRNNYTLAPGAALPEITASPAGSIRAMSKTGANSSPVSGKRCGTATSTVATRAAVTSLASTGGSRRMCVLPQKSAAPPTATSARDGTTIRDIDVAVSMVDPLYFLGLRRLSAPNGHRHQAHLYRNGSSLPTRHRTPLSSLGDAQFARALVMWPPRGDRSIIAGIHGAGLVQYRLQFFANRGPISGRTI
jgi:hypothetical protein